MISLFTLLSLLKMGCQATDQELGYNAPPVDGYTGPLFKTFVFQEIQPWAHLPCPKGHFISSLTYHFSGPFPEDQKGMVKVAALKKKKMIGKMTTENSAVVAIRHDITLTILDALHIYSKEKLSKKFKTSSSEDFVLDKTHKLAFDKSAAHQESLNQDITIRSPTAGNFISEVLPKHSHFPKTFGGCPTLVYCIGHQSCSFHLSNEFCQNDPVPGVRKHLQVKLMCEASNTFVVHLKHYSTIAVEFKGILDAYKWPDYVAFLNYQSQIEDRKRDYHNIEMTLHRLQKSLVFQHSCPSLKEAEQLGYQGECIHKPPDEDQVREHLWTIFSRIPDDVCQQEVLQVYCAYKYNPSGLCIPPFVLKQGKFGPPYFSFQSFPENGHRPNLNNYEKILQNPHMGLIPTRIGFLILAHQHPKPILQLIELLYRPEHYYVIHMDRRKEQNRQDLEDQLKIDYPEASNILVLPLHRSFVASWGSYYITRAELEGMEELLRMGVWDFCVVLSGADLPLRSVDDFALTLAPYRGLSFLRLLPVRGPYPSGPETAWHSCGGHVYNVTHRDAPPDELYIQGHSTWITLSRDATELVVADDRGSALDLWHFYLKTFFITDETYIATILANSPLKSSHIQGFFHFMKPFEKHDINGLCRHSLETDACGLGPLDFEPVELFSLSLQTHRNFFARKFSSNFKEPTRVKVIEAVEDDVYGDWLNGHYTAKILWELGQMALKTLEKEHGPLVLVNVTRWQAVPAMQPTDPCCKEPMGHGISIVNEFLVILTLSIRDSTGNNRTAKASIVPRRLHTCFPGGNIRFMHLTTRYDEKIEPLLQNSSTEHPFAPPTHPHGQPFPDVIQYAPDFQDEPSPDPEQPIPPPFDPQHPHPPQFDPRHPPHDQRHPPFDPRHPPFDPRHPPFDPRHPPFDPRHPPFDPRHPPFDPRHPPNDLQNQPLNPQYPPFNPQNLPFNPQQFQYPPHLPHPPDLAYPQGIPPNPVEKPLDMDDLNSEPKATQNQQTSGAMPLKNSPDYTRGDRTIPGLFKDAVDAKKYIHVEEEMHDPSKKSGKKKAENEAPVKNNGHADKQGFYTHVKPPVYGDGVLPQIDQDFEFEVEDRQPVVPDIDIEVPNKDLKVNNQDLVNAANTDPKNGDKVPHEEINVGKESPTITPPVGSKPPFPRPPPLNRPQNSELPSYAPPFPPRPFMMNLPVPYVPAGGDTLWLHMELYLNKPDKECSVKAKEQNMQQQHYMYFTQKTYPRGPPEQIYLDATIIDPRGAIWCKKELVVELSMRSIRPNEFSNKTMFSKPIQCGEMGPGLWTLQIKQRNQENPYVYSHSIFLLPSMPELYEDMALQHIHSLWSVGEVVLWDESFDEYYKPSPSVAMDTDSKQKPWFLQNEKPETMQNNPQRAKAPSQKQNREGIDIVYYVLFGVTVVGSLLVYNLCLTRQKTVGSAVRRAVLKRGNLMVVLGVIGMQILFYQLGRSPSLVPHNVHSSTHHSHHASSGF